MLTILWKLHETMSGDADTTMCINLIANIEHISVNDENYAPEIHGLNTIPIDV